MLDQEVWACASMGPLQLILFCLFVFFYYDYYDYFIIIIIIIIIIMISIVLKQKQRKYQVMKKREYFFLTQSAELQKDMLDMQQKVKRYKEHIYELESELQQRAELLASHEQKVTGVCHWCAITERDHRIVCFVLLTSLTSSLWFVYLPVFCLFVCLFVFCFTCGELEQFDMFFYQSIAYLIAFFPFLYSSFFFFLIHLSSLLPYMV